ncbi:MAG: hypothetical protein CMG70_05940 [Candidatus Marinimicrobia bacterium]|nr:hypothetical protein [Candidatus Neomarinimicrobiota bacterium]
MNNLNNKEKSLWELCAKNTLSESPSKDEVWMRLEQQIDIIEYSSVNQIYQIKAHFIKWRARYVYAFLLGFLLLMPTTIRYINTNRIVAEFGVAKKNIILSDGTKITLNAGSTLSYTKEYNYENRKVFLMGEAYFNVKKNHIPFIVSTEFAQVEVLGTKFNVRSRQDGFEAGVNEGNIEIKHDKQSMVLNEGQCAIIQPTNKIKIDSMQTSEFYPGWLNNIIECKNTTLEKICSEIERRYNVKISFKDESLQKMTVSGKIHLPQNNINSVMRSISLLTKRELKLKGGTYIIL